MKPPSISHIETAQALFKRWDKNRAQLKRRLNKIKGVTSAMVTESISDDTLMGSVGVSLEDLNRSIELLRERGYDITITYAKDSEGKLRAVIERAPGQLLISHGLPVVEGDVKLYFGAS